MIESMEDSSDYLSISARTLGIISLKQNQLRMPRDWGRSYKSEREEEVGSYIFAGGENVKVA